MVPELPMGVADGEGHEAHGQKDHTGHIPPDVLSEAVIEDAEPGEHLTEEPADDALRHTRSQAAPGESRMVEPQVDHLDECVNPGEDANAPELVDEDQVTGRARAERVEDPDSQAEEERYPEEDGANAWLPLRGEPVITAGHGGISVAEAGERRNHARSLLERGNRSGLGGCSGTLIDCLSRNIRREHAGADDF